MVILKCISRLHTSTNCFCPETITKLVLWKVVFKFSNYLEIFIEFQIEIWFSSHYIWIDHFECECEEKHLTMKRSSSFSFKTRIDNLLEKILVKTCLLKSMWRNYLRFICYTLLSIEVFESVYLLSLSIFHQCEDF